MIKLGGLSGYLYKGRKRKARMHLEYPLVFVLGDSLGHFIINQDSEEWTGLGDRLFMVFFPMSISQMSLVLHPVKGSVHRL